MLRNGGNAVLHVDEPEQFLVGGIRNCNQSYTGQRRGIYPDAHRRRTGLLKSV